MADRPSKLELNTARARDIARLPDMTERLALRVVRYRERNGPFQDLSDLENVRGVSGDRLDRLKDLVSVDPGAASGGVLRFAERSQPGAPVHVFNGTPRWLTAEIPLTNTGNGATQFTPIAVRDSTVRAAGGQLLTEIAAPVSLMPGEQSMSSISVALDPATAPGVYTANMVLQDELHPVVFNVAESIETVVNPTALILLDAPGSKVEKTLFVTNSGNVTLRGGHVGPIILGQDFLECRIARSATRRLSTPSLDDFVGAVSDDLKSAFAEIEPMRIRTTSKPEEILPGDTAVFALEFEIPRSAKPGWSYHGLFHLFEAAVGVVLVPGSPLIERAQ